MTKTSHEFTLRTAQRHKTARHPPILPHGECLASFQGLRAFVASSTKFVTASIDDTGRPYYIIYAANDERAKA